MKTTIFIISYYWIAPMFISLVAHQLIPALGRTKYKLRQINQLGLKLNQNV